MYVYPLQSTMLEWIGIEFSLTSLQHMWIEMNTCASKQGLNERLVVIWGTTAKLSTIYTLHEGFSKI